MWFDLVKLLLGPCKLLYAGALLSFDGAAAEQPFRK